MSDNHEASDSASFARAMQLVAQDPVDRTAFGPDPVDAVFVAELNRHWTIGPKIHGGVMLALCANAARRALAGPTEPVGVVGDGPLVRGTTPLTEPVGVVGDGPLVRGTTPLTEPVAVSASFLSAPDPGPVTLAVRIRKRGRTVSLADVDLIQGERVAVRTVITLAAPEHDAEPLLSVSPALAAMPAEPPADLEQIGPGHPLSDINHLADGCDIRPDIPSLFTVEPGSAPLTRFWVRPRGEAPDVLFALLCGDISTPATFALGRTGWAPTVQLTAYLRGIPVDGWLRVVATATQVGQDWFDEDHTVADSAGRIIVQTRQLAMVPAP